MTILREYQPKDEQLLSWVLDVRRILTRITHRDNVGPVVTFRYLAARMPLDVAVPVSERPLGLVSVAAINRRTLDYESGCRVRWQWRRGVLRIYDVDVSSTTDEYDVTLNVWMG